MRCLVFSRDSHLTTPTQRMGPDSGTEAYHDQNHANRCVIGTLLRLSNVWFPFTFRPAAVLIALTISFSMYQVGGW